MIAEGSGRSPHFQAAWRTINFSCLCLAAVKPVSSGSGRRPLFTPLNVLEASSSAQDFVFLVRSEPVFTGILSRFLLEHDHLKAAQLWRSNYGEEDLCNWRCKLPPRYIILIAIGCMWLTSCFEHRRSPPGDLDWWERGALESLL